MPSHYLNPCWNILLIVALGTNVSEILIKINTFSWKKMHLKMSSGKRRTSCLGLNLLKLWTGNSNITWNVTMKVQNKDQGPDSIWRCHLTSMRKSHCRDETILRPSYFHNGIFYTGKAVSLYWIGAQAMYSQRTPHTWHPITSYGVIVRFRCLDGYVCGIHKHPMDSAPT